MVKRTVMLAVLVALLLGVVGVVGAQDAAQLKSDEWRGKVSSSIMTAIDNYFSHQLARLPM